MKPEVALESTDYIFRKGMTIDCKLRAKVNPPQVNYTWESCDGNCHSSINWKHVLHNYSLKLDHYQEKANMKYRCTARNAAGEDNATINIFTNQSKFHGNVQCLWFNVYLRDRSFIMGRGAWVRNRGHPQLFLC